MFAKFIRYLKDHKASVSTMSAMMFPALVGLTALGVDASSWMMERRNLQTAADAAAIAAAWEAARGNDEVLQRGVATTEATNNGFAPDRNGLLDLDYDDDVTGAVSQVSVTLSQDAHMYFAKMIMPSGVRVEVSAEAIVTEPGEDFCILSLDSSASGAVTTSGTVDLMMPDCGIAVNSSADDALTVNGNVDITVEDINIVGGIETNGGSGDINYESLVTGGSVVYDPYADVEIPDFTSCTAQQMRNGLRVNRTRTLTPGVYCGGITVTGNNTLTFSPGVYILDGGGLSISGGGSVIAHDVTIILTNSGGSTYGSYGTFDITGNRNLYFSATDSGDTAGIVLFQDRNAPANGVNRILGSNVVEIDGVIYIPSQEVNYGGGVAITSDVCTQIIGRTVIMHGTPYLGTSCDGSSTRPIGLVRARLSG